VTVYAHVAGFPLEETVLMIAPAGAALVAALRATLSVRRPRRRGPP
jgi:hypothetical protein